MADNTNILEAVKVIEYDPEAGAITRTDRRNSSGSIDAYGYLIIKIKGHQWKAHRLAWAKYYGVSPRYNIDHIDRNKLNNAIDNLRDVPQPVNVENTAREANPETGHVGIYIDRTTNGLRARYTTRRHGRTHRFRRLEDAVAFREGAAS